MIELEYSSDEEEEVKVLKRKPTSKHNRKLFDPLPQKSNSSSSSSAQKPQPILKPFRIILSNNNNNHVTNNETSIPISSTSVKEEVDEFAALKPSTTLNTLSLLDSDNIIWDDDTILNPSIPIDSTSSLLNSTISKDNSLPASFVIHFYNLFFAIETCNKPVFFDDEQTLESASSYQIGLFPYNAMTRGFLLALAKEEWVPELWEELFVQHSALQQQYHQIFTQQQAQQAQQSGASQQQQTQYQLMLNIILHHEFYFKDGCLAITCINHRNQTYTGNKFIKLTDDFLKTKQNHFTIVLRPTKQFLYQDVHHYVDYQLQKLQHQEKADSVDEDHDVLMANASEPKDDDRIQLTDRIYSTIVKEYYSVCLDPDTKVAQLFNEIFNVDHYSSRRKKRKLIVQESDLTNLYPGMESKKKQDHPLLLYIMQHDWKGSSSLQTSTAQPSPSPISSTTTTSSFSAQNKDEKLKKPKKSKKSKNNMEIDSGNGAPTPVASTPLPQSTVNTNLVSLLKGQVPIPSNISTMLSSINSSTNPATPTGVNSNQLTHFMDPRKFLEKTENFLHNNKPSNRGRAISFQAINDKNRTWKLDILPLMSLQQSGQQQQTSLQQQIFRKYEVSLTPVNEAPYKWIVSGRHATDVFVKRLKDMFVANNKTKCSMDTEFELTANVLHQLSSHGTSSSGVPTPSANTSIVNLLSNTNSVAANNAAGLAGTAPLFNLLAAVGNSNLSAAQQIFQNANSYVNSSGNNFTLRPNATGTTTTTVGGPNAVSMTVGQRNPVVNTGATTAPTATGTAAVGLNATVGNRGIATNNPLSTNPTTATTVNATGTGTNTGATGSRVPKILGAPTSSANGNTTSAALAKRMNTATGTTGTTVPTVNATVPTTNATAPIANATSATAPIANPATTSGIMGLLTPNLLYNTNPMLSNLFSGNLANPQLIQQILTQNALQQAQRNNANNSNNPNNPSTANTNNPAKR